MNTKATAFDFIEAKNIDGEWYSRLSDNAGYGPDQAWKGPYDSQRLAVRSLASVFGVDISVQGIG